MLESLISGFLSRQLSTYLNINPGDAQLSLLSQELKLSNIDIRSDAINDRLQESPLLLQRGTLGLLQIQLRPLLSNAIHIVLENLIIIAQPRQATSPWWAEREQKWVEQGRTTQLDALDPEGAAVHAAVAAVAKGAASTMVGRLGLAVLSALKVEVRNIVVEVQVKDRSGALVSCTVHVDNFTLLEGYSEGVGQRGGLLGAATAAMFRKSSPGCDHVSKACTVGGLAIWLDTRVPDSGDGGGELSQHSGERLAAESVDRTRRNYEVVQAHEGMRQREAGDVDKGGDGDGAGEMQEGGRPKGRRRRYLLQPHKQNLELCLSQTSLVALKASVSKLFVEVDTADVDPLLEVVAALLGPPASQKACNISSEPGAVHGKKAEPKGVTDAAPAGGGSYGNAVGSSNASSKAETGEVDGNDEDALDNGGHIAARKRTAAELWQMAVVAALGTSSAAHNFSKSVLAYTARRRYAVLYETWLRTHRWNGGSPADNLEIGPSKAEKVHRLLQEAEKDLPLEAVVLARRIARSKASSKGSATSAVQLESAPGFPEGTSKLSLSLAEGSLTFAEAATPASWHGSTISTSARVTRDEIGEAGPRVAVVLTWYELSAAYELTKQSVTAGVVMGALHGNVACVTLSPTRSRQSDDEVRAGGALNPDGDREGPDLSLRRVPGATRQDLGGVDHVGQRWTSKHSMKSSFLRSEHFTSFKDPPLPAAAPGSSEYTAHMNGASEQPAIVTSSSGWGFWPWPSWLYGWRRRGEDKEQYDEEDEEEDEEDVFEEVKEEYWGDEQEHGGEEEGKPQREEKMGDAAHAFVSVRATSSLHTGQTEHVPSRLLSCHAHMGRLNIFLSPHVLLRLAPLVAGVHVALVKNALATPGSRSQEVGQSSSGARRAQSGAFTEGNHPPAAALLRQVSAATLHMARTALLTAVPVSAFHVSVAAHGPCLTLSSYQGVSHPEEHLARQEGPGHHLESSIGRGKEKDRIVALVVDTGFWQLDMWPLEAGRWLAAHADAVRNRESLSASGRQILSDGLLASLSDSGRQQDAASCQDAVDWRNCVEQRAWRKLAPLDCVEHVTGFEAGAEAWNNVHLSIRQASVRLTPVVSKEDNGGIVDAVSLGISASLIRKDASSLFTSSSKLSAAVLVSLPAVRLHASPTILAGVCQVLEAFAATYDSLGALLGHEPPAPEGVGEVSSSSAGPRSEAPAGLPGRGSAVSSTSSSDLLSFSLSLAISIQEVELHGLGPPQEPKADMDSASAGSTHEPSVNNATSATPLSNSRPLGVGHHGNQGPQKEAIFSIKGIGGEIFLGDSQCAELTLDLEGVMVVAGARRSAGNAVGISSTRGLLDVLTASQGQGAAVPGRPLSAELRVAGCSLSIIAGSTIGASEGTGSASGGEGIVGSDQSDPADSGGVGPDWARLELTVGKVTAASNSLAGLEEKAWQKMQGGQLLHVEGILGSDAKALSFAALGGLALLDTAALALLLSFPATCFPEAKSADEDIHGPQGPEVARTSEASPSEDQAECQLAPDAGLLNPQSNSLLAFFCLSVKVEGFTVVLVHCQPDAPVEGFLVEAEGTALLEFGPPSTAINVDVTRVTLLGLQATRPRLRGPALGSFMFRAPQDVAQTAGEDVVPAGTLQPADESDHLPSGSSLASLNPSELAANGTDGGKVDEQLSTAEAEVPLAGQSTTAGRSSLPQPSGSGSGQSQSDNISGDRVGQSVGQLGPMSSTGGLTAAQEERCIVQCLRAACKVHTVESPEDAKWQGALEGQCSIRGTDVAITTSEIQLLVALITPFSKSSAQPITQRQHQVASPEISAATDPVLKPCESMTELNDGAVIAIKDAVDRKWLSVEEVGKDSGKFCLAGVPHYSLAGACALFKVHYPFLQRKRPDATWFCLLSLAAHTPAGEPLRLHFQPQTGLPDISSTGEGSWELWRLQPYDVSSSSEDSGLLADGGQLSMYDCKHGRRVHLINRKSGRSLAIVGSLPSLLAPPGHPLKLHLILPTKRAEVVPEDGPRDGSEAAAMEAIEKGMAGKWVIRSRNGFSPEGRALNPPRIPKVEWGLDDVKITILYEAGQGNHMLPLVRLRLEDARAVAHAGPAKARAFATWTMALDTYEAQRGCWGKVVKRIPMEGFFRVRFVPTASSVLGYPKPPVTVFTEIGKVDMVVGEEAMDTCLFLIGSLELAGPYAVKHSAITVNRCQVKNSTGLDLVCRFDSAEERQAGIVHAHDTGPFLVRHKAYRRDSEPVRVTSAAVLSLRGPQGATTALLSISLSQPGVSAVRTRIVAEAGRKGASGPTMVVDISNQTQAGTCVSVGPLLTVRNDSGLPLDLRFRRPDQPERALPPGSGDEEGAVITLSDGDVFDDAMVAFEGLELSGERRRIVAAMGIGRSILSIRPSLRTLTDSDASTAEAPLEWSSDVAAAQPVRVSGWMDSIQRGLRHTMGDVFGRGLSSSFACVECKLQAETDKSLQPQAELPDGMQASPDEGPNSKSPPKTSARAPSLGTEPPRPPSLASEDSPAQQVPSSMPTSQGRAQEQGHPREGAEMTSGQVAGSEQRNSLGLFFILRTSRREVPLVGVSRDGHVLPTLREGMDEGRQSGAWMAQQELVFLPTIRFCNMLPTPLLAAVGSSPRNIFIPSTEAWERSAQWSSREVMLPGGGAMACLHSDLSCSFLILRDPQRGSTSSVVRLETAQYYSEVGGLGKLGLAKEREMEVVFGGGDSLLLLRTERNEEGVLLVTIFPRYSLANNTRKLLHCAPGRSHPDARGRWQRGKGLPTYSWPISDTQVIEMPPGAVIPWLDRSSVVLLRWPCEGAQPAVLDLESLSGSAELSLQQPGARGGNQVLQLGVQVSMGGSSSPTKLVQLAPRYWVENDSPQMISICQDGFQGLPESWLQLPPKERIPLHAQVPPDDGENDDSRPAGSGARDSGSLPLSVRFCPEEGEGQWEWSGPVLASALGSFSLKLRGKQISNSQPAANAQEKPTTPGTAAALSVGPTGVRPVQFAVAEVAKEGPSLVMCLRPQSPLQVPYRIENGLRSNTVSFSQKGVDELEYLEGGNSVGYVWDDISLPRKLVFAVPGSQLQQEINPDKVKSWRLFRSRRKRILPMDLPFGLAAANAEDEEEDEREGRYPQGNVVEGLVGYEVYADGPTRVVRICGPGEFRYSTSGVLGSRNPTAEFDVRCPLLGLTLMEAAKQVDEIEAGTDEAPGGRQPILYLRVTGVNLEMDITADSTSLELKVERADVDVKWVGAPMVVLLRPLGSSSGQHHFLHMAAVLNNLASDPRHLRYMSFLLQAVEVNLDEGTLMKLVPFVRMRAAPYTGPPTPPIYFERFEIHPIKVVGSFLPGQSHADYTSAQETLRALLHSVIKIPEVKGAVVELNGVLLTHALLSYTQLAMKCAQHYSWYAMRAIYIARGSALLPPGFTSLFDDSASSSMDVFFDPSNGSIDVKNITLGMFNLLRKGLRKRGEGGASRYLGDIEKTLRQAGSNVLYAVVTEVSDAVLKAVESNGLDGFVSGLRRGILKVTMQPSMLQSAAVRGGSTRRLQLARSIGTDEVYVEGYLQALLDTVYKQEYLRVKVSNDEVVLKNLPPNSTLTEEMMSTVRQFLVGEGLLAGESSEAAVRSLRRLHGAKDKRLAPAVRALCEQLAVIVVVRSMRKQTMRWLHLKPPAKAEGDAAASLSSGGSDSSSGGLAAGQETKAGSEPPQKQGGILGVKNAFMHLAFSSAVAYLDGRLCRHIPHPLIRRIVSAFLLSFVEF